MTEFPLLTVVIFLPVLAVAALAFVSDNAARWLTLGATLLVFLAALPLWWLFDSSSSQMQFVERASWITVPPIEYSVGVDGISFPLFLMTAFLMPFCVLVSWAAITTRVRSFMAMLLVMETAMLGVFAALDSHPALLANPFEMATPR